MWPQIKHAIIFGAILGVVIATIEFVLKVFFNFHNDTLFTIITVMAIVLGSEMGLLSGKKKK